MVVSAIHVEYCMCACVWEPVLLCFLTAPRKSAAVVKSCLALKLWQKFILTAVYTSEGTVSHTQTLVNTTTRICTHSLAHFEDKLGKKKKTSPSVFHVWGLRAVTAATGSFDRTSTPSRNCMSGCVTVRACVFLCVKVRHCCPSWLTFLSSWILVRYKKLWWH